MKFSVVHQSIDKIDEQCLIVFISQQKTSPHLSSVGQIIDQASDQLLSRLVERNQLDAELERIDVIFEPKGLACEQLMVVGLGDAAKLDMGKTRKLLSRVIKTLGKRNIDSVAVSLADFSELTEEAELDGQGRFAQWWVESAYSTQYQYTKTKPKKNDEDKPNTPEAFYFHVGSKADEGGVERSVAIGRAIGEGMNLSKDLANMPGNVCTPTFLATTAQALGKEYTMTTTVLDEAKMKRLRMGALLSVSKGSREPAKLITIEYKGAAKDQPPVVLVGKGLTFDAGGISLKPAATMDEMKFDMCGGASVLGVMRALGELKLPINVVGVIASSENLPDGAANKPGDVVTSMKGLTIEILNTDAEGRLILCDALTYVEKFKPAVVIDIATLTGACMIALGQQASGLFSNDDKLADAILAAGRTAGDRAWRMPVWDEYQQQLKSNFADVANIGGRFAGAVTAACFLKRFAEDYRWAHLDIAGTAWKSGTEKGATGRPVGLLVQYLLDTLEA